MVIFMFGFSWHLEVCLLHAFKHVRSTHAALLPCVARLPWQWRMQNALKIELEPWTILNALYITLHRVVNDPAIWKRSKKTKQEGFSTTPHLSILHIDTHLAVSVDWGAFAPIWHLTTKPCNLCSNRIWDGLLDPQLCDPCSGTKWKFWTMRCKHWQALTYLHREDRQKISKDPRLLLATLQGFMAAHARLKAS